MRVSLISLLISLLFSLFFTTFVAAQTLDSYTLGTDDVISVTVFDEPDLSSQESRISSAGTISMPLIGQVSVSGLTIAEVEEKIRLGYLGDYLKKPDINVAIVEYRHFYVNGEVEDPGSFSFREGMTVQRAISLSGGFSERAARGKIRIVRENNNGVEIKADLNTLVRPGDVITVDESFF
ncbi:polysaccharide export protein [Alteromonas sp. 5E99-2]|uniref:polysaccharide biosynthesis/export family protein n=1 Tax=Alteromonas sp. 5E99-2 TaxID=2817683 RepID=UPI001A99EFE7|nr:polysaccharide biosynthesis/export family protein [Alteromonas sp. 5E99-2]MBO1254235.1 polysaccharide export protein [Alteromonas sp. 5E99-2]